MNAESIVFIALAFVGGFVLGRPRRCIVAIVPRYDETGDAEPEVEADIKVDLAGFGHARSEHLNATVVVKIQ